MAVDPETLRQQVRTLLARNQVDQALALYEATLAKTPHQPDLWCELGSLQRRLGHTRAAGRSYLAAAEHYRDQGQDQKVLSACQRALDIDADLSEARQLMQAVTARLGRSASRPIPAEPCVVLTRRNPAALLAALRAGLSDGLSPEELRAITAGISDPVKRDRAILRHSLLFEGLSDGLLKRHASPERIRHYAPGNTICQSGQGTGGLHSILHGEALVWSMTTPPREMTRLRPGALLGEQSFVGSVGMQTRVEAATDVTVVSLDRPAAEALLTDHPASLYAMLRVLEQRLLHNVLQRAGFFSLFLPEERDALCRRFEILEVAEDEVMVSQGSASAALYLLMSGMLEQSHVHPDGTPIRMSLAPGGVFGEESFVDGRPAALSARTQTRCWIMVLRQQGYRAIIEQHHHLAQRLEDMARRRRELLAQSARGELVLTGARWPDVEPPRRAKGRGTP